MTGDGIELVRNTSIRQKPWHLNSFPTDKQRTTWRILTREWDTHLGIMSPTVVRNDDKDCLVTCGITVAWIGFVGRSLNWV